MRRAGYANAKQLADGAGIGYPAAWRIVNNKPVQAIHVSTLLLLAKAFRVKNPLTLLEYVPD